MGKPLLTVLPTLALTLAACGTTSTRQPVSQAEQAPRRVTFSTPSGPVEYTVYSGVMGSDGTARPASVMSGDGTPYEVYLPSSYASWDANGRRLALYAHGYTDPIQWPVRNSSTLPTSYEDSGGIQPYPQTVNPVLTTLQQALVNGNFAFAWSSYNKPGYAVKSGVESTNRLIDIADDALEQAYLGNTSPTSFLSRRRYVLGHSLGGIIGVALAEKVGPPRVNGVLAMCGPVNGMTQQVRYAGDLRALYDYYFQNNYRTVGSSQIPTTNEAKPAISPASDTTLSGLGWSIVESAPGTYTYTGLASTIAEAVKANLTAARSMASIDQLKLPYTNDAQLVHAIVDALFYPVRGVSDALATANGSPFDNRRTSYTRRGKSDAAVNNKTTGIIRYAPTQLNTSLPTPAQYVAANYDTTGSLKSLVLTLHTNKDPQVPYSHETNYYSKVSAKRKTWNLAQQYVDRYGHCSMSSAETEAALTGLVTWVETGGWIRPRTGNVTLP